MKTSTKRKAISKLEEKKKILNEAIEDHLKHDSKGYKGWDEPDIGKAWRDVDFNEPDSTDTVEQVMAGYYNYGKEPINPWKLACIAILMGIVAGLILATQPIINALDVCLK